MKKSKRIFVLIAAIGVALLGCCVIFGLASPNDQDRTTGDVLATERPAPTATLPPAPTVTPVPTQTPVVTESPAPLATEQAIPPSATDTPAPEPTLPPAPTGAQVVIAAVDKRAEFVDLQNVGGQVQDLGGWLLRSERGMQDCPLGGVIEPGQTLRVWALAEDAGQPGFNCGFGSNIWNNSESDPAVLYDADGREVDRK